MSRDLELYKVVRCGHMSVSNIVFASGEFYHKEEATIKGTLEIYFNSDSMGDQNATSSMAEKDKDAEFHCLN